jgi:hypothetical protein
MFTTKQYRDKAAEYQVRRDTAITPAQKREYQELEQRFTTLADNEQWLSDNYNNTRLRRHRLIRASVRA